MSKLDLRLVNLWQKTLKINYIKLISFDIE